MVFIRHFLKICFIPVTFLALTYFLVLGTEEFTPVKFLLASGKLQKSDTIYSPKYRYNVYDFKLRLVEQYRPKTVVIGSSRAHQLNADILGVGNQFYNMSGTVRSLLELQTLNNRLFDGRHESFDNVFLVIDFWWFGENYRENANIHTFDSNTESKIYSEIQNYESQSTIALLMKSLKEFWSDFIFSNQFRSVVLARGPYLGICDGFTPLGFYSIFTCSGYRNDGTFHRPIASFSSLSDLSKPLPEDKYFLGAGDFCEQCFARVFEPLIAHLETEAEKITIILPPIPDAGYKFINHRGQNRLAEDLINSLTKLAESDKITVINGHEAGMTNEAFYDRYHPSKIIWKIFFKIKKYY